VNVVLDTDSLIVSAESHCVMSESGFDGRFTEWKDFHFAEALFMLRSLA